MKDIFIDNNIAKNFSNPIDKEYQKLIRWLKTNDKDNPENNAFLVVSKKLIGEYLRSSATAHSNTSIPSIIDFLTRENRLNRISNEMIKDFKRIHFTKKNMKKLKSNNEDREHIPVVLLSFRKFALCLDNKFIEDLSSFSGFTVRVEKRPEKLDYNN